MDIGYLIYLGKITKKQRMILHSLAVKGPDHIQGIQLKEGMKYPTVHRSIKEMEKQGLVWLSDVQNRGPKSAQKYSLTPLGLVASIIFCDLSDKLDIILVHWRTLAPSFIKYWYEFEYKGITDDVREILNEVYVDASMLTSKSNLDSTTERSLVIRRNSLDLWFLKKCFDILSTEKKMRLVDIISGNGGYREVWDRFYSYQKFLMSWLDSVNERMKDSST